MVKKSLVVLVVSLTLGATVFGQGLINIDNDSLNIVNQNVSFLIDTTNKLSINDVIIRKDKFLKNEKGILNFYQTKSTTFWFHLNVSNHSPSPHLLLNIDYPLIDKLVFYHIKSGKVIDTALDGLHTPFHIKSYNNQNPVFNLNLAEGDTADYFIKVQSAIPVFLPVKIGAYTPVFKDLSLKDALTGIYIGVILALFLYNIFIFFTVKDKSYIYYVIYIFFMGLTQVSLLGYTNRFVFPENPALNNYAFIIFPAVAGVASIIFTQIFLDTKKFYPKLHNAFYVFVSFYIIAVIFAFFGKFYTAWRTIDANVSLLVIFALGISIAIARKGSRPAMFYLASWSILIVCIILYTLRSLGVLPYNHFTSYLLYLGSAAQAILLSIALADRINAYKKEKEASQAYALKISRENEKLIKEQNIVLEQKVAERTDELQNTNKQLTRALGDLKDAQTQLVEAEKMASLGQLTAGIAHEINNPINFVKSNIKPLRLDIDDIFGIVQDYSNLHTIKNGNLEKHLTEVHQRAQALDMEFVKTEIKQLLNGIEEGAERTAEIVRGLKTFSRLDEGELKKANVHDGIDSTLVLLKNSTPRYVKIEKIFAANGEIDCFPGKLNQVFMNIINNGIQAISQKKEIAEQEYITIATEDTNNGYIRITIKDTGVGMSDQVKHRIFEPFFTTKAVGEGTGLGMAIVFKIIEEHNGKIEVISAPGKGAEFIITLPHVHTES